MMAHQSRDKPFMCRDSLSCGAFVARAAREQHSLPRGFKPPDTAIWHNRRCMVNVQSFGLRSSQATRAAERFFKERRATIHFVDLKVKPMAAGEIRRFTDRYRLAGVLDVEGKAYGAAGLKYMKVSDADLLERIARDPALLRLPLIRCGNLLSVGQDEAAWKAMAAG